MKTITHIKSELTKEIITTNQQNSIKGGGWGSGSKSRGHSCPPPSLMAEKDWMDNNMS